MWWERGSCRRAFGVGWRLEEVGSEPPPRDGARRGAVDGDGVVGVDAPLAMQEFRDRLLLHAHALGERLLAPDHTNCVSDEGVSFSLHNPER